MAALSDLINAMAWATGLPTSTVFAYGRFARESGLIAQKTRGPGAAKMSVRDAANLVMAVCGTDITRKAGSTIKALRPLKGAVHTSSSRARAWLSPLGFKRYKGLTGLKSDFGSVLEFLIESSASGALHSFLSEFPFDRRSAPHFIDDLSGRPDPLLDPLSNAPYMRIHFYRSFPLVEVRATRYWHGSEDEIFSISFAGSAASARTYPPPGDLRVVALITAGTLAAVGFTAKDKPIPNIQHTPELHDFFPEQKVSSDGRGAPS